MSATREYYQDKVAVVTGGASGIGLVTAHPWFWYGLKGVGSADLH